MATKTVYICEICGFNFDNPESIDNSVILDRASHRLAAKAICNLCVDAIEEFLKKLSENNNKPWPKITYQIK